MTEKKDSLRKKAKSNLDSKGWEALLEGVSRTDEGEKKDRPAESTSEAPSVPEEQLSKTSDESQEKTEPVTFGQQPPEPQFADAQEPQGQGKTGDKDTRSAASGKEAGSARLKDWITNQPTVQRALQYYQGLNPREQKIILLGLTFVLVLFIYTFVFDPMLEENALLNRKIDKKSQELTEMVQLRASVTQDRGGMDHIKKIIEQRSKAFSIFAYLEQLATKAEMKDKIIYIKPQRETSVGPFRESLAEIKLEKIDLEELTRFLYQIETSEDLLYIKNMKMKTGKSAKDPEGLDVTLSVGTLLQQP